MPFEAVPAADMAVRFTCEGELLERKLRALRAQASQIQPLIDRYGLEWFRPFVADEFFRQRRETDPDW